MAAALHLHTPGRQARRRPTRRALNAATPAQPGYALGMWKRDLQERDWERAEVLESRTVPRVPELVSDGGGLPFPPAALDQPSGGLDPADPTVAALLVQLSRLAAASLDDWRLLAGTEDQALFGRGRPPRLHTAAFRRNSRRGTWTFLGESAGRPLRAARDGIRASSWRLDPTWELTAETNVLRLLLTEQAHAGGKRADGRVLVPDVHVASDEIVLTIFVSRRPGFQMRRPNPETPIRVALPCPVGDRQLVDGALYPGGSVV
jgi:hypothetical protein